MTSSGQTEPQIAMTQAGNGQPVLILHGGGGPFTVASIANHLSAMQTFTPTHPGWNGTERPDWYSGVDDLALSYLQFLEDRNLKDVLVIGSSLGGWIAAEMAVRDRAGLIGGQILIDAVGIQVEGAPIMDFFSLDPKGIAENAYHDAERFFVDPATVPAEQIARQRANSAALRVFAGDPYMHDPKLLRRLSRVKTPTLVIWGESDRIVTPTYGMAFAAAFQNARFELVKEAGHLPHIEQPDATFALIDAFTKARV
jgi:pimeloyl-ACP methyl ester carboxylesterase